MNVIRWVVRSARGVSVAGLLIGLMGSPAVAQFMYLDTNGDGQSSDTDRVTGGETTVDVWLDTITNASGGRAKSLDEQAKLTINSYEMIIKADGGKIEFGDYTNLQPTMNLPVTDGRSDSEMHVGFAGIEILPPGKYHLGRFAFRVLEGNPRLSIGASSEIDPRFHTSFGSMFEGVDGDNTLKLSSPSTDPKPTTSNAVAGDWTDTGGLASATEGSLAAAMKAGAPAPRFSASIVGSGRDRLKLRVATTRPGFLRVAIFDVQGRLVSELTRGQLVSPGIREIDVNNAPGKHLSAGVYFYRVATPEGITSGRFAMIK